MSKFLSATAGSLALTLALVFSMPAAAKFDCPGALLYFASHEEARRDLRRAYAKDPRLGLYQLTAVSTTLDWLDNFSSPALLRPLVVGWAFDRRVEVKLARLAAESKSLREALERRTAVPPHVRLLLEVIESRFRLAVELTGFAMAANGRRPELTNSAFARRLVDLTTKVVDELKVDPTYEKVFADFDFRLLAEEELVKSVEVAVSASPFFDLIASTDDRLQARFTRAVGRDESVLDAIEPAARALGTMLKDLPVGITYAVKNLTSSVRFGPRLFLSGYFLNSSTMRRPFLRTNVGWSVTSEVVLKMSRRRKKLMALILDRSHQDLDFIFGLNRRRGYFPHTCGSFAPLLFWRCGVPVVTPVFFTPGTAVASLYLQKFLGFKNVEDARVLGHRRPFRLVRDSAVIYIHEFTLACAEIGIVLDLGRRLKDLVHLLL